MLRDYSGAGMRLEGNGAFYPGLIFKKQAAKCVMPVKKTVNVSVT